MFFIRVPQSNWCLNAGEPLGPVQFILWPDVSYQVFIPIMSCFVTEIDQNCMKDVIDHGFATESGLFRHIHALSSANHQMCTESSVPVILNYRYLGVHLNT